MTKLLKIITVYICLGLAPMLMAEDLHTEFRTLTIKDGLAGRIVFDVCQDRTGYVWIGTNGGLNRYDGYSMASYCHITGDSSSLCNSCVTSIYEDSCGQLWIGTSDGISIYDRETDSFTSEAWTEGMYVRQIMEDSKGNVWVATNKGCLFRNGEGMWTRFHTGAEPACRLPDDYVTSIMEFGDDIWIGAGNHICTYNRSAGIFRSTSAPGNGASDVSEVYWLCKGGDNDVYVGTSSGLYLYDAGAGGWTFLLESVIRNLAWKDGRLWVATQAGLYAYDPDTGDWTHWYHVPGDSFSLADNLVWSVDFSRDGIVWIATENGVSLASWPDHSRFISLRSIVDWDISANVQCICRDSNGRLWLGTTRGVIKCTETDGQYKGEELLQGYNVRDMYEDQDGRIWFATDGGLFSCLTDTGQVIGYDVIDPGGKYSADWVYSVFGDCTEKDLLWLGTFDGGVFSVGRKKLLSAGRAGDAVVMADRHYGTSSLTGRLPSDLISSVLMDSGGMIWASTNDRGLCRIDARTGEVLGFTTGNSGLCSNDIGRMKPGKDGKIWIQTGLGLCMLEPSSCRIERAADMVSEKIIGMETENDCLWLITNTGISRYDTVSGTIRPVHVKDAVYNTLYFDGDSTLFVGCNDGIIPIGTGLVDLARVSDVSITGVSVDGRPIRFHGCGGQPVTLPYRENDIAVTVSSFDFSGKPGTRFAYRLEGYDNEVRYLSGNNVISYLNLSPGKYRLLVSSGSLHTSGSPASMEIWIRRPWYSSAAAFLLYLLSAFTTAFAVYRYLLRKRREEAERDNTARSLKYAGMELSFYTKAAAEFKSPLSLIIGEAQLLYDSPGAGNFRQETGVILNNAMKIRNTVEEMLSHKGELFRGLHVEDSGDGTENQCPEGGKKTVLVLGSDMEDGICAGIVSGCRERYRFICSGVRGIEVKIMESENPDIVLIDDTLPDKECIHTCHRLKEPAGEEYVPVLVLRKDVNEAVSRVLKLSGADAVIPVSAGTAYVEEIMGFYIDRPGQAAASDDENSLFMASLVKAINDNMDNEALDMDRLSEIMKTGRKQLYRKTRQLAGVTTVEFIRMLRLEKAADLCRNGNLPVSEIMYKVGFSSHSYFAKCFREEYGMTPKEYIRMYREA